MSAAGVTADDVRRDAEAARRAQDRMRNTVRKAVGDGVTVSEAATAAGVTRQTIYRWIGRSFG